MIRRNHLNHNRAFMWGIMAMAFVVIAVAALFMYWCMPATTAAP